MHDAIEQVQKDIEDFRTMRRTLEPILSTTKNQLLGRIQSMIAIAFPDALFHQKPVKKRGRQTKAEFAASVSKYL